MVACNLRQTDEETQVTTCNDKATPVDEQENMVNVVESTIKSQNRSRSNISRDLFSSSILSQKNCMSHTNKVPCDLVSNDSGISAAATEIKKDKINNISNVDINESMNAIMQENCNSVTMLGISVPDKKTNNNLQLNDTICNLSPIRNIYDNGAGTAYDINVSYNSSNNKNMKDIAVKHVGGFGCNNTTGYNSTPIRGSNLTKTFTSTPNNSVSKHSYSGELSNNSSSNQSHGSSVGKSNSKRSSNNLSRKSGGSSMCLGDFIVGTMKTKRKSHGTEAKQETIKYTTPPCSKPKKRVAPTTVSTTITRDEFNSSSFKSDNNLSNFSSPFECSTEMTNERDILKRHKDKITRDFIEQNEPKITNPHAILKDKVKEFNQHQQQQRKSIQIDLNKVTNRELLHRYVDIYTILIDMNLTVNVLSELAYMINLVNVESDVVSASSIEANPIQAEMYVLKNLHNCVYFSLEVLDIHRIYLVMLDTKTLKILLENDRITKFKANLMEGLQAAYNFKIHTPQTCFDTQAHSYSYVFFQQENDSKENFPSEREFAAFKKQRDIFYAIFK